MKLITAITAAVSFASGLAKQSAPFYLVVHSDNSTLNGKALAAYHEGAGIEGLAVAHKSPPPKADREAYEYQFNTTSSQPNQGILTWAAPFNGGSLVSKLKKISTHGF